ncbi:DUF11 domain-containing protein [Halorubrum distributum]|uniref:DUF11 domain-containing protein n=1 Tax=Halorubrum distributum JCM 13916 TaxID=1230455 RepID=M0PFM9_9EURY|nr:DUF11 domain-containing protein [Halorubrum arcis]EMA68374.1 hypothetical protein C462_13923 [Halorubrum arcis JCM 13916]
MTDERPINRRRVLQTVGVGGAISLAGCTWPPRQCDLSVTKAHVGDTVSYGTATEFEITVCNDGDGTCEDTVTVTDDLPSGVTYAGDTGTDWNCTESGGVVTCEHPNANGLSPGDCLPTLTLAVDVGSPDEVGDVVRNCVTVEQGDPNLSYKTDCVTVPVTSTGECDLSISKAHRGDLAVPGSASEFEITVCNEGDGLCRGPVPVVDSLPNGVTFLAGSGSGWSVSESGGVVGAEHPNSGGLAPGDCLPTLTLEVEIGSIDETGDAIRNCASVESDDADSTNNRDCISVPVDTDTVGGACDLSIRKEHDGEAVAPGGTTEFQITVCNVGGESCRGSVPVVDSLPSGVTFLGGSGSGWSVSETGGVVTAEHPNSGGLAAGDCLPTLTLEVEIGSIDETGDAVRNCASIKFDDANSDNNQSCVSVPIDTTGTGGDCDLSIEKVHEADSVAPGDTTEFEITVCNDGDGLCRGPVPVIDALPSGVTFLSGSGSGWSVSESGGVVSAEHQNSGGLAPGDCLPTLTLEVEIGSIDETGDAIRNCASIESDDGNARNNRSCVSVPVQPPQASCDGLNIEKTTGGQFQYGQQSSYEIDVCMLQEQTCDGQITVTDTLPGGISFVSASGSGWNASASGGTVTATHPNSGGLSAGQCLPTLVLTVAVAPVDQFPGGSDGVQNCAQLSADGAFVDEDCVAHVITN